MATILCVVEEPVVCNSLECMLENRGYQVTKAVSLPQAKGLVGETDLVLSNISGIAQQFPGTKVLEIGLSSSTREGILRAIERKLSS